MRSLGAFVVTLTLLVAACATVRAGPQLSAAEVIRLADAEARRHGNNYEPRHFKRADAHYVARFHRWWVNYDPKPGERGREAFTIDVDDKTKQAGLILP